MKRKVKVMSYYTYENKIGGPRTYIRTLEESTLSSKYDFCSCYQNEAPGGLSISLLIRMIRRIKELNPDIVHVHGAQSEGFYGVIAAHLAGCHNIVLTIHGFAHDDSSCTGFKFFLYKFIVEPITLLLSTKIYTVCKYAALRPIVRLFGGNRCIGHVYNPAPQIHTKEPREITRAELGISDSKVVLCIVSRVSIDKGYKTLEQVIKNLKEIHRNKFCILIVGDGEYMKDLEHNLSTEIADNHVFIIGQTDNVGKYLCASDIFVFPSLHENLSIALLEAARAKLACVVSDVGGNPEIILDKVNGITVPCKDSNAYVQAISALINDRATRSMYGSKAKETVHRNFSINSIIPQIDNIYSSLAPTFTKS